jgi:hypothetical protein
MSKQYSFDDYPFKRPKVKMKNSFKLSREAFFETYGTLIFQRYVQYCNNITEINMDSQLNPYIKIGFFTRYKKDFEPNKQIHILDHETKVSEIVQYKVKKTHKVIKTHAKAERKVKKGEVTYIPRVITSIETTENESEESRSRVIDSITIAQTATVINCDLVFTNELQESGTQTNHTSELSISSSSINIPGEGNSEVKLTACSTSSIHISAADHFVSLDEPRKPMYRHMKSRMGLGKLVEKPESVREMWLAQEIAMLRGQNIINWESKTDQLMGTLFLHEQTPMTQPETTSDQELANQISALTSDAEVMEATEAYFNN